MNTCESCGFTTEDVRLQECMYNREYHDGCYGFSTEVTLQIDHWMENIQGEIK